MVIIYGCNKENNLNYIYTPYLLFNIINYNLQINYYVLIKWK